MLTFLEKGEQSSGFCIWSNVSSYFKVGTVLFHIREFWKNTQHNWRSKHDNYFPNNQHRQKCQGNMTVFD